LEDVKRLLEESRKLFRGEVYGYKVQGELVVFGPISSADELPLGFKSATNPGFYRLERGVGLAHSHQSPKCFLYPPRFTLFRVREDLAIEEPNYAAGRVVLFGVKPCDLAAISVLDGVFSASYNPYYQERRSSVVGVIVEECLYPGETCFCASVEAGPLARDSFDVAYAVAGEDLVFFKPGSENGSRLLEKLGLEEAVAEDAEAYAELSKKAVEKVRLGLQLARVQEALWNSISDVELWRKLSEKCVGCANCNLVCPTCFCAEVVDEVGEGVAERHVVQVGCLSYTYGLVAGGHFRKELYTRYRHFVLHKFVFYPRQVGRLGCVGCGRCVVWCPAGIDIREALKAVCERR
jgi:ferredoxin